MSALAGTTGQGTAGRTPAGAGRRPAGAAWRAPGPAPATAGGTSALARPEGPLAIRLIVFAALAAYAVGHWYGLLADPPIGRAAAVVATATLGGAALALGARLPPVPGALARWLLAVAVVTGGFVAGGLPAAFLLPWNWPELVRGLATGLTGLQDLAWPLRAGDDWARLVLTLCAPLAAGVAGVLAFWPATEGRAALRGGAMVLLLVLFGVAVTTEDFRAETLRGAGALVLVGTYLWLPRAARPGWPAAVVALALTAAIAIAVGGRLGTGDAVLDHRDFRPFGPSETTSFQWDHRYGPITWSRTGIELLEVRARRASFWRVQTLGRFDGRVWTVSGEPAVEDLDLPAGRPARWTERARVRVGALESDLAVGPGTMTGLTGDAGLATTAPGGAVRFLSEPEEGATYDVEGYRPRPTPGQLRRAPTPTDPRLARFTRVGLDPDGIGGAAAAFPLRAVSGYDGGAAARAVADSAYARVGRLARRLGDGRPGAYEVARRVQAYLELNYPYEERPPRRRAPLDAFLFEDRTGYCQHFSGAMALLLRMNGVPARVATGFSPGDRAGSRFTVTDRDAHSWVEVHFTGLGWVAFDPTPAGGGPAEGRAAGVAAPLAERGDAAADLARGSLGAAGELAQGLPRPRPDAGPAEDRAGRPGGGVPWWGGVMVGLAAAAVAATLVLRRRPDREVAEVLEAARRVGLAVGPATTLLQAERALAAAGGPGAAEHARRLRRRRFAPRSRPPTRRTRRAMRRVARATGGPLARLRAWAALPPGRCGRRLRARPGRRGVGPG